MWIVATILAVFCVGCSALVGVYLLQLGRSGRRWQKDLADRTATVNRLLDFSQIIQSAGKPDQVFATLSHYLRSELNLAGLVVLTEDAEAVPALQLRQAFPRDVVGVEVCDMDTALCPSLRQNLPQQFRPDGAPLRCCIDGCLKLDAATHPAYCIPFTVGRHTHTAVHMLLPPGVVWTEERRQLSQTYVNSAQAALANLHLLAEAEKQSMTDPLTGLFNRRSMDQLLQREVLLAERYGHPLSLVMIDLDHFKEVNDAHGHAAGDYLLRAFADCVRITVRKTDLAFRYGGDEFLIALPQTPLAQAQQVMQKVRQAYLAADFSQAIAKLDVHPTLSMGVTERSRPMGILTLEQLLAAADNALYSAKTGPRNCIHVYQPPRAA